MAHRQRVGLGIQVGAALALARHLLGIQRLRADSMLGRGDLDGQRVWLRIVKAVKTLLETRPGDGAAVH